MKSKLVKTIRDEFDVRKVMGKKIELYRTSELLGILTRLRKGEVLK